jgi:hypothetical protein
MKTSVIITKSAKEIINTFTKREKETYDYLLELYNNTIEKEINCQKEIDLGNTNPKYKQTLTICMNEKFRLSYILQCLDLYVGHNTETNTLNIKTKKDK